MQSWSDQTDPNVVYQAVKVEGQVIVSSSGITTYQDSVLACTAITEDFDCENVSKNLSFYVLALSLLKRTNRRSKQRYIVSIGEVFLIPYINPPTLEKEGLLRSDIVTNFHGKSYIGSVELKISPTTLPGYRPNVDYDSLNDLLFFLGVDYMAVEDELCLIR